MIFQSKLFLGFIKNGVVI